MLHKDTAETERNLLHELIEGCMKAEGYKVERTGERAYVITTKQGNKLNLYFSVKSA